MSILAVFIDPYILCIISLHLGDKQIFNFRNISPIKSTNEYCPLIFTFYCYLETDLVVNRSSVIITTTIVVKCCC